MHANSGALEQEAFANYAFNALTIVTDGRKTSGVKVLVAAGKEIVAGERDVVVARGFKSTTSTGLIGAARRQPHGQQHDQNESKFFQHNYLNHH